MKKLVLCTVAAGLLLSCAVKNVKQTSEMPEGERLYRANCASCHALRKAENYTDAEWEMYVAKYGQKLDLTDRTRSLILDHLQASN